MLKIQELKRIEASLTNIQKYKPQYYGLSHVRTGEGYEGIILIDKGDKFVAVLQCHVKEGMIQALDVSQGYRRQGVASYLLSIAAKEFACSKLTVNANNTKAIALYEKYGYVTHHKRGVMLHMEKGNRVMMSRVANSALPLFPEW